MKLNKVIATLLATAATATLFAQVGSSISIFGSLEVSEGGTGQANARIFETTSGLFGSASFSFTTGEMASLNMIQLTQYTVPGSTAFFGGPGLATIRRGSAARSVRGNVFVMVDDLDHDHLPFPDQMLVRFTSSDGTMVLIRHCLVTRGDIRIVF